MYAHSGLGWLSPFSMPEAAASEAAPAAAPQPAPQKAPLPRKLPVQVAEPLLVLPPPPPAEEGVPMWVWIATGVTVLGAGAFIYSRKKGS